MPTSQPADNTHYVRFDDDTCGQIIELLGRAIDTRHVLYWDMPAEGDQEDDELWAKLGELELAANRLGPVLVDLAKLLGVWDDLKENNPKPSGDLMR